MESITAVFKGIRWSDKRFSAGLAIFLFKFTKDKRSHWSNIKRILVKWPQDEDEVKEPPKSQGKIQVGDFPNKNFKAFLWFLKLLPFPRPPMDLGECCWHEVFKYLQTWHRDKIVCRVTYYFAFCLRGNIKGSTLLFWDLVVEVLCPKISTLKISRGYLNTPSDYFTHVNEWETFLCK